jgi:hypothetical protein
MRGQMRRALLAVLLPGAAAVWSGRVVEIGPEAHADRVEWLGPALSAGPAAAREVCRASRAASTPSVDRVSPTDVWWC